MKRILSILFAGALITSGLQAKNERKADSDTVTVRNILGVTVTAPRMAISLKDNPSATTIVGADLLKKQDKCIAIDEAMALVPGVRVDNQAAGERVHLSVRGMGILTERGVQGIKVILDGIPLNDPAGFAPDLLDIDWNSVERIEVLRGPAAALYGGSANGGVINITTKCGGDKPFGGEVFSTFGSDKFWKSYVALNGSKDRTDYRVSFSRTGGDGYRIHSGFWGDNAEAKINWSPSDGVKLTQILKWTESFSENPEGISLDYFNNDPKTPNDDAIPRNEFQYTKRLTGGFAGTVAIDKENEIAFNLFAKTTSYKEAGSKYMWNRNMITPGGSVQYNRRCETKSIKNLFSVGADVQYQNMESIIDSNQVGGVEADQILSNDRLQQTGIGFFINDRIEVTKDLAFVLNLRYDNVKNNLSYFNKSADTSEVDLDFNRVTAKIGVSYSLAPSIGVYANWGQGFLPPTTEGLVNNPVRPGGVNTSLSAATSMGEEIGIRGTADFVYYDLAAFYMTTKDDFNRYRKGDRPMETFYQNLGDSKRFGIEAFVAANPIKDLNVRLAYTFNDFKYSSPDSIKDNNLPNCPKHKLDFDVDYKFFNALTIGFGAEMQSEWNIFFYDLGIPGLNKNLTQDGFTILNARVNYEWKLFGLKGDLFASCKNIADKMYMGFTEPDDGGNCYQPAAGRQFFAGFRVNF